MADQNIAPQQVALIGGTGPEGRGLATRLAMAGHHVVIGSRKRERAAKVADALRATLAKRPGGSDSPSRGSLSGAENVEAAREATIAIIVVPYEGHRATIEALADELKGKIVVDAVVPVRFDRGPRPIAVEEGSATEQAARLLPDSRVIGAFHNLSAEVLLDPTAVVHADVLVTGADAEAKAIVCALAEGIEGVRAVDAGPLRYSRFVEGITVLLIGINGRYKAHSHVRIAGLPA